MEVEFENGNRAALVAAANGADPDALVREAGLPVDSKRPVVVVCGEGPLDGRAVAEAAERTGAVVVAAGAGAMRAMGEARAAGGSPAVLVGVAPADRVTYPGGPDGDRAPLDPHHTHFLLANSGTETPLVAGAAEALAGGGRVVMALAGDDAAARAEAERRGWPVLAADAPARDLAWELQDEPALKDAWRTFATYDGLAVGLRKWFGWAQAAILALGVAATLLALLHGEVGWGPLHWGAVALPLVASGVIAFANRRGAGAHWVLLRGAAEAIKAEIFRYRTRTGGYAGADRDAKLAAKLDELDARLLQTDAANAPLTPYDGPLPPQMYGASSDDDGLSELDAERYVRLRLGDQLSYYHGKVGDLNRRRTLLQAVAIGAGLAGALVAAAGADVWIGLTTAIAAGALTFIGTFQIDATIVAYNQSAGRLAALTRRWEVTGVEIEELVKQGESALATELGGWVQQMTEALEKLRADQEKQAEP